MTQNDNKPAAAPIDDLRRRICKALDLHETITDDEIVTAAELHRYEFRRLLAVDVVRGMSPAPSPADGRAAFEAALDKRAKSAGFEVGRMTECELDNAWWGWQAGRAASANETGAEGEIVVPIELSSVAETLAEGDGFWRSCSGCHETNEGHETGHYPYSKILKCHLGGGCSECGGIGAVWDDTDYEAMGRDFERSLVAPSRSPAMASEAVAIPADYALVPIEPTTKMLGACKQETWIGGNYASRAWKAMIAAAPQPVQADARVWLTDEQCSAIKAGAAALRKLGGFDCFARDLDGLLAAPLPEIEAARTGASS
ncbi:TPA: hypothetical protein QDA76_002251 [Burkholderia vietnamiensis]|nr:hypothetical protein [Burkholderia vietnamiensis]HDR9261403.1 hypothetical protein [Burkholderia vietnamiensis]